MVCCVCCFFCAQCIPIFALEILGYFSLTPLWTPLGPLWDPPGTQKLASGGSRGASGGSKFDFWGVKPRKWGCIAPWPTLGRHRPSLEPQKSKIFNDFGLGPSIFRSRGRILAIFAPRDRKKGVQGRNFENFPSFFGFFWGSRRYGGPRPPPGGRFWGSRGPFIVPLV